MGRVDKLLSLALVAALIGVGQAEARAPGDGRSQRGLDRGLASGWAGGQWTHGWHTGRFGWWWTVGPSWYWYAQPTYPYPAYPFYPQQSVEQDYAPAQQGSVPLDEHWFYCNDPKGYYPYVEECRHDWRIAPVVPSLGAFNGGGEHQYYCNDPAGYYPYIADCKREWRIVPAIVPPR